MAALVMTEVLEKVDDAIALTVRARLAQRRWACTALAQRLHIVRRIRNNLAAEALDLCKLFPADLARTSAQSLAGELLPLADAARFLEREAPQILEPRLLSSRSRPWWMRSVEVEVRREPFGVVLIIGPSNYPLFIPCVQALQALVAGNAVVLKPGRGGAPIANAFRLLSIRCGIPADLFSVLDEYVDTAQLAIESGIDKVVVTGSPETGKAVYRQASRELIPAVLELSGSDAVFIQAGADLDRAVEAIAFGCEWNAGNTCIAPRRIFVIEELADEFERRLHARGVPYLSRLSITRVRNDDEALSMAAASRYALGASVFGPKVTAQSLAARISAGVVVVNDVIAPTADPRVPFGGRAWSGFGTTRGAEGLLEFTAVKAVVTQNAKRLRHLEPLPPDAEQIFAAYLCAAHATSLRSRWNGLWRFLLALTRAGAAAK